MGSDQYTPVVTEAAEPVDPRDLRVAELEYLVLQLRNEIRNLRGPANARQVDVQWFLAHGGRLSHMTAEHEFGPGAVVTVAYWAQGDTLFYGAVVFHPDSNNPVFNYKLRKAHNETAVARLFAHAAYIPDPPGARVPDVKSGAVDFLRRDEIFKGLPIHGVRGGKELKVCNEHGRVTGVHIPCPDRHDIRALMSKAAEDASATTVDYI